MKKHPSYNEKENKDMAKFINEPSHTFNEYLLIPGYSSAECIPANVSLKTPLVKYNKRAGEKPAIEMNIPMISAIMQSVSGDVWLWRWRPRAAWPLSTAPRQSRTRPLWCAAPRVTRPALW